MRSDVVSGKDGRRVEARSSIDPVVPNVWSLLAQILKSERMTDRACRLVRCIGWWLTLSLAVLVVAIALLQWDSRSAILLGVSGGAGITVTQFRRWLVGRRRRT